MSATDDRRPGDATVGGRGEPSDASPADRLRSAESVSALPVGAPSVDALIDGYVHDLANLLTGIMGCCRLAERKLEPDSAALPYLVGIRAGAERGTQLIRRLIDSMGASPRSTTASEIGPSTAPATVLMVEDERLVRMTVREYLSAEGYIVLEASSPEVAMRMAEQHQAGIDLLLTDMIMPGMNGRDLAARLSMSRPEMKVIFMSAHPGDWLIEQGHLDPGDVTLSKPFTSESLLALVGRTLHRS